MTPDKAREILSQVVKDATQWGAQASLRVQQHELVDALVALGDWFSGAVVSKEDLTYANRSHMATKAQLEKCKADLARIMEERDTLRKEIKRA